MPTALKKLPGPTQNVINPFHAGRTVKMFSPRCDECQGGDPPTNWWQNCPHFLNKEDLYFEASMVPVKEPIVIDDPDDETGLNKIVSGFKDKLTYVRGPRLVQVPLNVQSNSGDGVKLAIQEGCLVPQDLGYVPYCQLRECWSNDIKVQSERYGQYCSTYHAKLAIADASGVLLNVTDGEARQRQLDEISI